MLNLENGNSTVNQGYSLFLSGANLSEVKPLFASMPHNDHDDTLEFSTLKFQDICDILVDYELTSSNAQLRKRIAQNKPMIRHLISNPVLPKFKLAPHDYQKEALKYALEHPRFLLGDEMGLGKSGTMIFLAEILKAYYGFKHTLIVCGINGAKFNWHMIEIPKFSYESSHIIGGRVNKNGTYVIGDISSRIADLQAPHDEFYLIINIESLRDKDITETLKTMIMNGDIGLVVIDEVHKAAGRTSAQGKAIHQLRTKFRVGLTGTPIHNKPFDLYNIMKWLGYEYRKFEDFRLEYSYEVPKTMVVKGRMVQFYEYVYKDLSMLHNKLKEFMLRRTVDVLKLPTPIFKDEYVELDKSQLKLYNKIKEDIIKSSDYLYSITTEDIITNPAVGFIKARQAVSCPSMFGVNEDAKLERVIEIVEEALEDAKSVVIFAWFNATISHYYSVLHGRFGDSILIVDSSTDNAQEIVSEFQNSTKPAVLIGTIGKLGTSFTITKADIVIFVDKHVVWSDYKQAYMRVWRQGQTKNVLIINIMAKDTIDERLEYLIALGKSHSEQVVDGIESNEYINKKYSINEFL